MNALVFHDTQFDIVDRDGQPWLKASDVARALGYAREDSVSRIYDRNTGEFTATMTGTVNLTVPGNIMPIPVRIFSLRGAHLVAMLARTKAAAEFRRWVLDVLESKAAPAPVTPLASARNAMIEWTDQLRQQLIAAGIQPAALPALDRPSLAAAAAAEFLASTRFVLSVNDDLSMHLRPVPAGARMIAPEELPALIADPGAMISKKLIPDILRAAAGRL
ncbi:BRO-N domain-containing protein [Chitinolyticbacter meiyuanensis]|uniref:BRO-N domain-containing protein n=1 Tax=Chitinolyticbacter meiyuanensis TaxID=682798 RepID=UPI0011E5B636|nr:BRO family protein [Chitinolyticbacter meiyuanensis]